MWGNGGFLNMRTRVFGAQEFADDSLCAVCVHAGRCTKIISLEGNYQS